MAGGSGRGSRTRRGQGVGVRSAGEVRAPDAGSAGAREVDVDRVLMDAVASDYGRVYQAAHDQTINQQTILPAEAIRSVAEVQAPPGLINLPHRTDAFVGRNDELERLDAIMDRAGKAVLYAVHGLGGVGKSALAAQWAGLHATEHCLTWSITADSPTAIEKGLADLAVGLQPELAGMHLTLLTERAVQWLACHDGWLLLLDNVQRPADIQWLLGRAPSGRYLVTTRLATGWYPITSTVIHLDVLSALEAADLLTRIVTGGQAVAGSRQADLDGMAELCGELGNLPLAIEQAAAFLRQTQGTPRGYLTLLAKYPAEMYDQAPVSGDAERTVARIWRVTLDQLASTPMAGQLLGILAWYGIGKIPRAALDPVSDPLLVQQALGQLGAYNMVNLDPGGATVRVHRLVQAVARTPDTGDPHRQPGDIQASRETATRLLAEAFPENTDEPALWPACRALLPHIEALADTAEPDTDTADTVVLLNRAAQFLDDQGAPAQAIRYFTRAGVAAGREFGEDHPNTLAIRANLAHANVTAGYLDRAVSQYEEVLADAGEVLSSDDSLILISRSNLAVAYKRAGHVRQAIALYEQALADCRRVLGRDHIATLACQVNLATAYEWAGDLSKAIKMFKATLADMRRVLGQDHRTTLDCQNNLAHAYQSANMLGEAIPLFKQTLTDCRRVVGEDHPLTLTSWNNLAFAYGLSGDLPRAISLYEQTLDRRQQVLSPDHPGIAESRINLAGAYESVGQAERAIPLLEQVIAQRQRVLGEDHPETMRAVIRLATTYMKNSDLLHAIPLLRNVHEHECRVLGGSHPDTLQSGLMLATAYLGAKNIGRAIPQLRQLIAHQQEHNADSSDAIKSRIDYAAKCYSNGSPDQAFRILVQVVPQVSKDVFSAESAGPE
jgi:tetratricopeptide (TPR) repeat protein